MVAKRNCNTCEHLNHWSGEYGEESGFVCEKRAPKTDAEEMKLLRNLDREAYRNRYKSCFEPEAERATLQQKGQ